jgi:uncharacterized protein YecT (DUF1311 family)
MSASHRLAALVIAAIFLAPAASADDDYTAAFSRAPTLVKLCGDGNAPIALAACKDRGYDKLVDQLDKALAAALAKAPANVRPLLKRDQAWFGEMMIAVTEDPQGSDDIEDREAFADRLRQRVTALEHIGEGFGRPGILGRWADAFGIVDVTPADGGAYRVAIDTNAVYGSDDDRRRKCQVTALVKPAAGGWLTGTILPAKMPAPATGDSKATTASPQVQLLNIKLHRQGETLRVATGNQDSPYYDTRPNCNNADQVTASYFASGKPDATAPADKADTSFVAPTFDCTRPDTASDEEICADPDLADNDQRLNRAWKALLPRLDEATRRALIEDQRHWVRVQAYEYPETLHPAWAKRTSFMHFTASGRDELNALQRERIALLEGFDEHRSGLVGLWLSYSAILKVTATKDGGLKAEGGKWSQGDWKGGCEFDMEGKVVHGVFRSDEKRKNPDTLERDHASLIVNRLDDVFAKKRYDSDDSDEPKCKRNPSNSSTARLFPVRPSPDIDKLGGSIR